ncbi:MAG: hypothetical protein OEV78_12275 [Spirochaetia bacterium]|nr:hypothetical protein [Spirochaetia bacterium]
MLSGSCAPGGTTSGTTSGNTIIGTTTGGTTTATRVVPTGSTTPNALAPCTLTATGAFALSCVEVSHSKINMADTTGVTITAALGATGLIGVSVALAGVDHRYGSSPITMTEVGTTGVYTGALTFVPTKFAGTIRVHAINATSGATPYLISAYDTTGTVTTNYNVSINNVAQGSSTVAVKSFVLVNTGEDATPPVINSIVITNAGTGAGGAFIPNDTLTVVVTGSEQMAGGYLAYGIGNTPIGGGGAGVYGPGTCNSMAPFTCTMNLVIPQVFASTNTASILVVQIDDVQNNVALKDNGGVANYTETSVTAWINATGPQSWSTATTSTEAVDVFTLSDPNWTAKVTGATAITLGTNYGLNLTGPTWYKATVTAGTTYTLTVHDFWAQTIAGETASVLISAGLNGVIMSDTTGGWSVNLYKARTNDSKTANGVFTFTAPTAGTLMIYLDTTAAYGGTTGTASIKLQ